MDPSTYCGASEGHVHFNNHKLMIGEPIKLFGIDGTDDRTLWLDMKNCSGSMDSTTFSLLSNLEHISLEKCEIQESCKAFALLEKLTTLNINKSVFPFENESFEGSNGIIFLDIDSINCTITSCFQHLNKLENLSFESCSIEINNDFFSGLNSLKGLSISNCKISITDSDAFTSLPQLQELNIRDSEITQIHFDAFKELTNLKFFSFHHNNLAAEIDLTVFEKMESLNTIHFDTAVYKILNVDNFQHLQNVRIGYTEFEDDPEIDEIEEKFKEKNITTEYVFCGTVDYNSDEMEECV